MAGRYRRNYRKKPGRRGKSKVARVSKPLKRAITRVIKSHIETKVINVPDADSLGLTNTKNRVYAALSGLQYLAFDIFKGYQGVANATTNSSANKLGDKINGVGFEVNYMFHTRSNYAVGGAAYIFPFVKLRLLVFRTNPLSPTLTQGQLCDVNYLPADTSVMQPIDWDEGYVKEVLFDKVYVIRNQLNQSNSSSIPNAPFPYGNVFHFKKYFKYAHAIKSNDSNASQPISTNRPIHVAILAEVDDSNTGLVPSGTSLLYTTGYTRAWFKDA